MSRSFTFTSLISILAALTSGCAQGQTGGEIGADDKDGGTAGEGFGQCVEVESRELATEEEELPITASDFTDMVQGTFEQELTWGESSEVFGGSVVISPDSGTTGVKIEIEVIEGSMKVVERAPKQSDSGQEGGAALDGYAYECRTRVTLEANVKITTDDGGLDEEFQATFYTEDGLVARMQKPVVLDELNGSFSVDISGIENAKTVQNSLQLAIAFGQIQGTFAGMLEVKQGGAVGAGGLQYAVFPKGNPCPYGVLVPSDNDLAKQTQDLLDAHQDFDFTWTDEDTTQKLSLESQLGTICYEGQSYDGAPQYSASVQTAASLEDGSIDGNWTLRLHLDVDEDGQLTALSASRDNYIGDSYEVDSFASATGISGIQSDADKLGFSFGYNMASTADSLAAGELTILAISIPECVSNPNGSGSGADSSGDVVAPDGGGSAGCEGVTPTEIKNAQFLEQE